MPVDSSWQARIIEESMDAVITVDSHGMLTTMNRAAERLFRCEAASVIGTSFERFIPARFTPKHHLYVEAFAASGVPALDMTARAPVRAVRSDGEEIEIEVALINLGPASAPSFACIIRDITNRRLAEARLNFQAELLEQGEAAAIALDAEGRVAYWNGRAERLYGWSREEALGADLLSLELVEDLPDMQARVLEATKRGEPWEGELRAIARDGQSFAVHAVISPVFDAASHEIGYVIMSFDLTERRRAEEALIQSQKFESLGVLAGGVAHDFNNILAAVIGNAHVGLRMSTAGTEMSEVLTDIRDAAIRAAELAQQLLAYAGKGHVATQPVSVNAIVEEMLHLLRVSIENRIVVKSDLTENLPLVMGDPTQVRQIVMNLVLNAADAVEPRSGRVSISTSRVRTEKGDWKRAQLAPTSPEGDFVCIQVTDSGTGMDAATRLRIFDPFFTTKFTGRGLGLAALFGIVRSHGGGIKVTSRVGRGSSFRIFLPVPHKPV
jgi:PAS domain S-box-containing protein